jgi:hypothetical protein
MPSMVVPLECGTFDGAHHRDGSKDESGDDVGKHGECSGDVQHADAFHNAAWDEVWDEAWDEA